jgi:hypothetical protein
VLIFVWPVDSIYTSEANETTDETQPGDEKMQTTIRIEDANNETQTRGVFKNADGTYTAMTFTQSKDFKTLKGAQKWLEARTAR